MVALSVCLCCETYFNFSEYTAANIFKFNLVCLFITAFSIVWALFLIAGTYERNKYSVTPHFLIEILVLCSLYLRTWDIFFLIDIFGIFVGYESFHPCIYLFIANSLGAHLLKNIEKRASAI